MSARGRIVVELTSEPGQAIRRYVLLLGSSLLLAAALAAYALSI